MDEKKTMLKKPPITTIMLSCLFASATFSASSYEEDPEVLLAAQTPISKTAKTKHKGWLANLNDIPSEEEIKKISEHVDEVMQHETNKKCTSVNPRLRKMIFLHFALYQYMTNHRSIYLHEENIYHWAHVFGMLLKESSGDTTSITSMTGRSYTTYQAQSDLDRWGNIAKLSKHGKIPLNYQTNFGLTQLSIDRLYVALKLAQNPAYFKGREKPKLNTAIAVRRLIWFYQDFAQGRLIPEHDRIRHHEKDKPEYSTRLTHGTNMAILLCGTKYMFSEGYHEQEGDAAALHEAMRSIAYCKLGSSKKGYGTNEIDGKCFAKWVTLCPMLNFDIAMLTPLRYFATRNAAPVCEGTFKRLLTKKPVEHTPTKHKKMLLKNTSKHEAKKIEHHQDTTFISQAKKFAENLKHVFFSLLPKANPDTHATRH